MILHRGTRELVHLPVTADVDLTAATLLVSIDGGAFTVWAWEAPATTTGTGSAQRWTRTARALLAGPEAPDQSDATVLAIGRHLLDYRVTGVGSEEITRDSQAAIDVR